jgi:hypothetical protein
MCLRETALRNKLLLDLANADEGVFRKSKTQGTNEGVKTEEKFERTARITSPD